ncbi:HNH endonuclease [Enterococcus faecalis]|nr:HNH endonuclease [Enterococcus faecalis]MCH1677402.1 HNH endonuclease [Enterococcus faecalis]MCH1680194.1 HNH endonuclease [Enterococcus faecalis]
MCEVCNASIATIVHHRQEVRTAMGWEHRLDIDNLESICQECHNKEEHAHSFRHRKG